MFSSNLNLKNNLESKTTHCGGIWSLGLLNTSAIYGPFSKVHAAAIVLAIAAFILCHRLNILEPVCRELNSDLFDFFKNPYSCFRTHSSYVSNSDTLFILARLIDPDP